MENVNILVYYIEMDLKFENNFQYLFDVSDHITNLNVIVKNTIRIKVRNYQKKTSKIFKLLLGCKNKKNNFLESTVNIVINR